MNNYKVVNKNNNLILVAKCQKNQQLNLKEVELLQRYSLDFIVPLHIEIKGHKFILHYNITGYITMKQLLANTMNKALFTSILEDFINVTKQINRLYLNYKNLELDFDYILINPSTKKLAFLYIPIQYYDNGRALKDFFTVLIQNSTFSTKEDTSYVKEFIQVLSRPDFSVVSIDDYIRILTGKSAIINDYYGRCSVCGAEITDHARFCMKCGSPIQEESVEFKTVNTYNSNSNNSNETTVLGSNESEGTTVLGSEDIYEPTYPYLIRTKSDEKIMVNKQSFRIGKEIQCDYSVSDNSAVSRNHADILTKNGRFFIVDNNSTNKTYVDYKPIPSSTEVEIFPGSRLRLANEDFEFNI